MAYKVLMPKLGMMEGDLSVIEWKVNVGDTVEKGQTLCVVEGQKITNDVQTEEAGVVRGIYKQPGEACKIGTVIAIIAGADEDISALVPSSSAGPAAAAPAAAAAWIPRSPPVCGTTTLLTFLMMLPLTSATIRSGLAPSASVAFAAA